MHHSTTKTVADDDFRATRRKEQNEAEGSVIECAKQIYSANYDNTPLVQTASNKQR
jgi:hypothetical protein